MNDQRPTVEIVLPDSKATFILFSYLRHGDNRKLIRKITDSINITPDMVEGKNATVDKISGGIVVDQEDYALELMTKDIKDQAGNSIVDKIDFIYNLTKRDGKILIDKVNELTNASSLSEEDKKK